MSKVYLFWIAVKRIAVTGDSSGSNKVQGVAWKKSLMAHPHAASAHWTIKVHGSKRIQHLHEVTQQVLKSPQSMIRDYDANAWVLLLLVTDHRLLLLPFLNRVFVGIHCEQVEILRVVVSTPRAFV